MKKLKRKSKFYIISLLFTLLSCTSLDKEEYEVLNVAMDQVVFKRVNPDDISKIMDEKNIGYSNALRIVQNEMLQKEYTYTISDTLYPIDIPKETWESLHSHFAFMEIKNRSDKSTLINFNKIKLPNNIKKIDKPINDSTSYIGYFKFHRVLFDKSKKRAYVQVEVPAASGGFAGLIFEKEDGKWKLEK
jgi:hypothetical protein